MFYNLIKDFQSALVGALGFLGVILTLHANAQLSEQSRARELDQRRQTLQSALHRELVSIHEEFEHIRKLATDRQPEAFEFTLEQPYVYRTLVKDLGILPPDKAGAVIRVHRDLYLYMNLIRGYGRNPDRSVVVLDPKQFPRAVATIEDIDEEVIETIKAWNELPMPGT